MSNSLPQRRSRAAAAGQQVFELYKVDPHDPSCIRIAARLCGESPKFVRASVERALANPNDSAFEDKHRSGRPRKNDYADVAKLVQDPNYRSSFRSAAQRSGSVLHEKVSASTVARAVHEQGLVKHKLIKGAILSPEAQLKRKSWATKHLGSCWDTTIMLDSTEIPYHPPANLEHGRWGRRGERLPRQHGGSKLHVYAAASPAGLSALHECTGTTRLPKRYEYSDPARSGRKREGVGADEARDVIEVLIKECMQPMSKRDVKRLKILMDRASPHTSKTVSSWLHSQGYRDFYLPAPGCDINWLDWTIWHMLKQRVYASEAEYETFEQFRILVHKIWGQMRDDLQWGWLSVAQAKRVAKIANNGRMLH